MSLQYILLGMLEEPASGYDLRKAFSESLAHFWHAELAQIYPMLGRMEEQGLLRSKREPSAKGPARRVYSRTAAGKRELTAWLEGGPEPRRERLTWLAQVFFLYQQRSPEVAREFLEALEARFAAELATLRAIEDQWKADAPGYPDELPDDEFYPQLTMDLGIRALTTKLEWCQACLARLEARERFRAVSDAIGT